MLDASCKQESLPLKIEGRGSSTDIQPSAIGFRLQYEHPNGKLFQGNSVEWLASLDAESVDLVFADPPYNIKKADWDNFESQEAYIQWSLGWVSEAARVLKPTGSLFVCGFSEIISDLKHPASQYFSSCRWLIWHYKNKANLGKDWGRSHESILHFRKSKRFQLNLDKVRVPYGAHTLKYPVHPQAESSNFSATGKKHEWMPHPLGAKPKDVFEIPTTCNGMEEKTPHPTQKPEELLRKIILSASESNSVVVDPFSGSGTTCVVAEQLGRKWAGCDLNPEYNGWAIKRLEKVRYMLEEEWILLDKQNAERRNKIR